MAVAASGGDGEAPVAAGGGNVRATDQVKPKVTYRISKPSAAPRMTTTSTSRPTAPANGAR